VFVNPQSILCGLIAGLMFIPTTIFDMVWGVRFLQEAHDMPYSVAVLRSAAVPFGWIIGCPLLGWLTDRIGRRKPVIIGAAPGAARTLALILFGRRPVPALQPGAAGRHRLGRGDDPVHGHQGSQPAGAQRHRDRRHQLHQFLADGAARTDLRARLIGSQRGGERGIAALPGDLHAAALRRRAGDRADPPAARNRPEGARSQKAPRKPPNSQPTEPQDGDSMSTTVLEPKAAKGETEAARDLKPGLWTKEINVRNFIQNNYEPYFGDESFLAGPTKRTLGIWKKLTDLFVEERKKGVLDVSQIPSSITAHDAGYIDKKNEVIVGLQTDAPLKRAIMPNGGLKMVTNGLEAFGFKPDPQVVETFTKYRKTHNSGVFDAYTADVRRCRSSHVLTGLPDAYGRGRIIGDYRRVALYGVDRLIERKQEKAALDGNGRPTRSSATARS
jgi:hypothetical protein